MREMPAIHGRNLICIGIDCVMGRDYSGRIWHRYQTEPIPFSTSMELIQKMDALYDRLDYPQRSTLVRRFGANGQKTSAPKREETAPVSEEYIKEQRGGIGTFVVRVKYRQNTTWQGEVVWADRQEHQYFRSALELLKLIDSALQGTEADQ